MHFAPEPIKRATMTLVRENRELGIIIGFLSISHENGEEYWDTYDTHWPDQELARAAMRASSPQYREREVQAGVLRKIKDTADAVVRSVKAVWVTRENVRVPVLPLPMYRNHDYSEQPCGTIPMIFPFDQELCEDIVRHPRAGILAVYYPEPEHYDEVLREMQAGRWGFEVGGFSIGCTGELVEQE